MRVCDDEPAPWSCGAGRWWGVCGGGMVLCTCRSWAGSWRGCTAAAHSSSPAWLPPRPAGPGSGSWSRSRGTQHPGSPGRPPGWTRCGAASSASRTRSPGRAARSPSSPTTSARSTSGRWWSRGTSSPGPTGGTWFGGVLELSGGGGGRRRGAHVLGEQQRLGIGFASCPTQSSDTAGKSRAPNGSTWRQSSGAATKKTLCPRNPARRMWLRALVQSAPRSKDAQKLRSPHARWSSWSRVSAADVLHPVRLSCPPEPRAVDKQCLSPPCARPPLPAAPSALHRATAARSRPAPELSAAWRGGGGGAPSCQ